MPSQKASFFAAILTAVLALLPGAKLAWANSAPHLIINEIQTTGESSSDEFVEIFNPGDQTVDLSSWSVQYRGGTSSTFYKKNFISGDSIPSHGFFLIAHGSDYTGAMNWDMSWSQSFSDSGGTIFLVANQAVLTAASSGAPVVVDRIAYGSGSGLAPETTAFSPAPDGGQSLERKNFSDTDDNSQDFFLNASPSPKNKTVIENLSFDETADKGESSQNPPTKCATSSADIKISEVLPWPSSGNEFVEIKNSGLDCVDVSGWKVMDEAGHKKTFPENSILEAGEYLFLEGNLYFNNDSDTAYLLGANGDAKNEALDKVFYEKAKENYSYALSEGSFSWTSTATPGEKNIIGAKEASAEASIEDADGKADADLAENYSFSSGIYLNELLPSPEKGGDEYIEIANGESEPVDLFGWKIKDSSKAKGYQFKEHIVLAPNEYLAIYKSSSKITLNNSSETIYLLDPKNELVSSVSFDKAIKNSSYNFDGEKWKWSKFLTPGKKNKFDSAPVVKIRKPKHVYKDLLAEFSAKAKDKETKKLKYAWNFGDGKKSSLPKTSHKYQGTGKYTVTLSVSDDSQTVEKKFVVSVKKSPRVDLEIVKLVPNPAGNDSEGEIVEIKNNSGQKVSLAGWKIATGSAEKIYNHPVSGEISLEPGETKTITREFSKFSLNNEAGKVQLVMSDRKVIDEVTYSKGKIAEDEAYVKNNGQWKWLVPNTEEGGISLEEEDIDAETSDEGDEETGEVLGTTDEKNLTFSNYNPSFSSEDAFIFLSDIGFLKSQSKEVNYCPLKSPTASLEYFLISSI